MRRRLLRGLLIAAALLGAAAGTVTSSLAGTRTPMHLTELQIVRMALQAAARSGDPRPALIQHTEGTQRDANRITAGAYIGASAQSYLIAARGHFIGYGASVPFGASLPRGTVITLIVNAATGRVTDGGISYRYPPLGELGPVTTDFRSYSACPSADRHRLTSITPGASAALVPPGARNVLLCRYSGVSPLPSAASRLLVGRLISDSHLVRRLSTRFDALPPFPSGSFFCPADFGTEIIAIFRYTPGPQSDDPVTVDPSGCASATNGHSLRAAMFPPGQALIEQLRSLTG